MWTVDRGPWTRWKMEVTRWDLGSNVIVGNTQSGEVEQPFPTKPHSTRRTICDQQLGTDVCIALQYGIKGASLALIVLQNQWRTAVKLHSP